jgi:hypothetical protein
MQGFKSILCYALYVQYQSVTVPFESTNLETISTSVVRTNDRHPVSCVQFDSPATMSDDQVWLVDRRYNRNVKQEVGVAARTQSQVERDALRPNRAQSRPVLSRCNSRPSVARNR